LGRELDQKWLLRTQKGPGSKRSRPYEQIGCYNTERHDMKRRRRRVSVRIETAYAEKTPHNRVRFSKT